MEESQILITVWPIKIATRNGFADIVRTLLAYGEKATNVQLSIIEKAKKQISKPEYLETLTVLKEAGLDID